VSDDLQSAVREIDVGGARDEDTTTSGEDARADADAAVDEATESHRAAEGAETSDSLASADGLQKALLRTSPETPLSRVESPWNPEEGGKARIYRALQKMFDFDGMPAAADFVIGFMEWAKNFEPEGGDDQETSRGEGIGEELPR